MSNANILSIFRFLTLVVCMSFVAGQGAAWAADDAAGPGVDVQKAHTIEAKVYRIPKNGEEWLGASDNGGIMELSYGMAGSFILPKPASMESCMETFGCDLESGSPGFAYKVDGDSLTDKFLPALEKMGGELLSAPRLTTNPGCLFKVARLNPDSGTGGSSQLGSGGTTAQSSSSPLGDDPFSTLKDLGLSPQVVKLVNENLGSSVWFFDIRAPENKSEFRGLVFACAVKPELGDGNTQLNVATHYRVADHMMKRTRVFGRKKPVDAGVADLQARYKESMASGDVLAFFQRLPHSGDTLLTVVTVEEVRLGGF